MSTFSRILLCILTTAALSVPAVATQPTWPDLAKLGTRTGGGEKDAAVLVAVENYAHVGKVAGAKRNLADWKHWLVDVRGVPEGNVFELTDVRVTPGVIRKKAKAAADFAQPGGTVWFVFIGHGVPAKDGSDAMLVAYDARQSDEVYAASIGRKDVLAAMAGGKQARTVFVADSCFSGGKDHGGKDIVRGAQPLVIPEDGHLRKEEIVFSAGKADQFAGPLPGEQRPAFTYLLLGGLMGWADGTVDGKPDQRVSVQEASEFARKALLLQEEREQQPEFYPVAQRDQVLATAAVAGAPALKELMLLRAPEPGPAAPSGPVELPRAVCPAGSRLEGGRCVAAVECPAGSTWVNGRCVALQAEALRQQPATVPSAEPPSLGLADDARKGGDDAFAGRQYELACQAGSARACCEFAYIQFHGFGVPKNEASGRALAQRHIAAVEAACGRGEMTACVTTALLAAEGIGLGKAEARAAKLLRMACESGNLRGCATLGHAYDAGRGVAEDPVLAVQLYRKACEAGYMNACGRLGFAHVKGRGVAKDPVRAAELLGKACAGGSLAACGNLAVAYANGWGVAKDEARAAELFHEACEGGNFDACDGLGIAYAHGSGVAKDLARAAECFRKGCEGGSMEACGNLGIAYASGLGVAKDEARAAELYRKACDGGSAYACSSLGTAYAYGQGLGKDLARAAELYRKACDGGEMTGCNNLGVMYDNGTGVAKDPARAAELYCKACDGGFQDSCSRLAQLRASGQAPDKGQAAGKK